MTTTTGCPDWLKGRGEWFSDKKAAFDWWYTTGRAAGYSVPVDLGDGSFSYKPGGMVNEQAAREAQEGALGAKFWRSAFEKTKYASGKTRTVKGKKQPAQSAYLEANEGAT